MKDDTISSLSSHNSTEGKMENEDVLLNKRWLNDDTTTMTLADMIGQMSQIDINLLCYDEGMDGSKKKLKPDIVQRYIGELGIGSVLNAPSSNGGIPWTAHDYRQAMIQINAVAAQYHHPPVIWGIDSIHGANLIANTTITPHALNIAATFNTSMAYQAGQLASRDTRAAGIHWLFSPLVGIALESKWSRVYETFGEDPVVVGAMASFMIQGIQTPSDDKSGSSIPSRAAACPKHYIGYSMPRTGHDRSPSTIPMRHLYQYFVPPWNQVLKKTSSSPALTVMESYTEINGIPMVANRHALYYLLRHRLHFDGVLLTDFAEIFNLHNWHHVADTDQAAVIQSLQQGSVDMSMIPFAYDNFANGIHHGIDTHQLSLERIQQSTQRILQLKRDLHMFDETITMENGATLLDLVGTDEQDVLPIVQDSLILTKNMNDLLPLDPTKPLRIHVTGPTANSLTRQSGGWTMSWQGSPSEGFFHYGQTVMEAFTQQQQANKAWTVTYSCGIDVNGNECDDPDETDIDESLIDQFKHWAGLTPTTSIAIAVQAAKNSDVTVICVGEDAYAEKPGDIRSLRLPVGQNDLVNAIALNTKTKILLVYFGGRPRLLSDMVDSVDAIILGFLPGPSAGQAVYDVTTGHVNPSGRLPITYPLAEDGGGVPYFHAVTEQCTSETNHWEYTPCPVQWPFGHGLSYTTFTYTELSASGGIDTDLHVSVKVTNVGNRSGADTVMFFTFDESRQVTPEYKRLRAFEKVSLKPSASIVVKKTIPLDELRFIGRSDDRHYVYDPHMISYVGVGYMTDCRIRDNDHNPDDNDLCVRLEATSPDKPYVAACEAACLLWEESGCAEKLGFATQAQCLELCMSINQSGPPMSSANDGWGWNYVYCLESVVWTIKDRKTPTDNCWLMTSMCRNVFQTGQLSEFLDGSIPTTTTTTTAKRGSGTMSSSTMHEPISLGYWLALVSGMLASFMIYQSMRGAFSAKRQQRPVEDEGEEDERFSSVQFTTIRNVSHDDC